MELILLRYGKSEDASDFCGVFTGLPMVENYIKNDSRKWSIRNCFLDKISVNNTLSKIPLNSNSLGCLK